MKVFAWNTTAEERIGQLKAGEQYLVEAEKDGSVFFLGLKIWGENSQRFLELFRETLTQNQAERLLRGEDYEDRS